MGSQKTVYSTILPLKYPYLGGKYSWENITILTTERKDFKNGRSGGRQHAQKVFPKPYKGELRIGILGFENPKMFSLSS